MGEYSKKYFDAGLARMSGGSIVDEIMKKWQMPKLEVDTVLDVSRTSQVPTTTPGALDGLKSTFGMTDGKFLGMDSGTWGGIASAAGVGKGLFDIFSGIQQGKLAKDYYKHQTGLQNEQMQMARDENKRIADTRSVLNTGYSGGA